jgi:hypothetical protein
LNELGHLAFSKAFVLIPGGILRSLFLNKVKAVQRALVESTQTEEVYPLKL